MRRQAHQNVFGRFQASINLNICRLTSVGVDIVFHLSMLWETLKTTYEKGTFSDFLLHCIVFVFYWTLLVLLGHNVIKVFTAQVISKY